MLTAEAELDGKVCPARSLAMHRFETLERARIRFSDAMDELHRASREMCCGTKPVEHARAEIEASRMKLLELAGMLP